MLRCATFFALLVLTWTEQGRYLCGGVGTGSSGPSSTGAMDDDYDPEGVPVDPTTWKMDSTSKQYKNLYSVVEKAIASIVNIASPEKAKKNTRDRSKVFKVALSERNSHGEGQPKFESKSKKCEKKLETKLKEQAVEFLTKEALKNLDTLIGKKMKNK